MSTNYVATKTMISRKKDKEVQELDDLVIAKKITSDEYLVKKRAIEKKYSGEIE